MPRDADELIALLDLERLDDDLYRGAQMPTSRPMVFGGQVAAQSLVAASRTVEAPFDAHSLHSYFLQPGDPSVPTIYDVENLRDGRSFVDPPGDRPAARPARSTRRRSTSTSPRRASSTRSRCPTCRVPDDPSIRPVSRQTQEELHADQWNVADIRFVGSSSRGLDADPAHPARQRVWLRVSSPLPDDQFWHRAAFTYLSDMTLIGAAMSPHGISFGKGEAFVASLDHAVWFHRPFRADEWWLYDQVSPSASSGRALVIARVFSQDGQLVASVAQEAVLRPRRGRS